LKKKDGKVSSFKFGDPKDYKSLSKEEKKDYTNKMLGNHKSWAGQKTGMI